MTAALAILSRVPILAWFLVAALGWGTVEHYRASSYASEVTAEKAAADARFARQSAAYATAAEQAASQALIETDRRLSAQQGAIYEAEKATALARADAASASDSASRLRQRFAAVATKSCPGSRAANPAVAAVGQAASAPADVLSNVLERVSGAAEQLAAYGDASRIAAETCATSYEALK